MTNPRPCDVTLHFCHLINGHRSPSSKFSCFCSCSHKMARVTRQSARNQASKLSASVTPTTNASPIFSSRNSVATEAETPITSDAEEVPKKAAAKCRVSGKSKRAAAIESDDLDEDMEEPPAKRRAVTHRAYVEIPMLKTKVKFCLTVDLH